MKRTIHSLFHLLVFTLLIVSCNETIKDAKQEARQPRIYPDYLGVTIPVNIAPLCFSMSDENALLIDAVITDRHGHNLQLRMATEQRNSAFLPQ